MKSRRILNGAASVFAAVAAVCALAGCAEHKEPLEGVSTQQAETIRTATLETYVMKGHPDLSEEEQKDSEIDILAYLGTYNETVVVKMKIRVSGYDYTTVVVERTVGGIYIGTCSDPSVDYYAYTAGEGEQSGKVVTLETAYEDGLVTKENLHSIAGEEKNRKG